MNNEMDSKRFQPHHAGAFMGALIAAVCAAAFPPLLFAQQSVAAKKPSADANDFPTTTVFESGQDGYKVYRIPAVIRAANDDLLAFCEARQGGDASEIDLVVKRSSDGGKSWGKINVVQESGDFSSFFENESTAITIGNPAPVVDLLDPQHPGRIWLPFTLENDRVFVIFSDDHGATWSSRREITNDVKKDAWGWYATGPVHSIQIQRGPHRGRLVIPTDHRIGKDGQDGGALGAHVVLSDDHGKTWRLGAIDDTYEDGIGANETTVVELADGTLYFNTRDQNGSAPGTRGQAWSRDGGETFESRSPQWKSFRPAPAVLDPPVVQCSLLRVRDDLIVFSGPETNGPSGKGRSDLRLRYSTDQVKSWVDGPLIHTGPAAYSDLVLVEKNVIGVLFENGDPSGKNAYQRISFTWVTLANQPTIVALGDSITKGVRAGVTAGQTFAAIVGREHRQVMLNVGIGGERTDQALKRVDAAVISKQPRFVLIMYGTNDSYVDQGKTESRITVNSYRSNLESLVSKLLLSGIEPILMTEPRWAADAPLNGIGEHPNVSLERFVKACRQVAVENDIPLIDHFEHWTRAEASGKNLRQWTTDGCHPNPAGHSEIAKLILSTLRGKWTPNTSLVPIDVKLETVMKRQDPNDKSLWFHPRLAIGDENQIVMTVQKHLGRSDHFSGLSIMRTSDFGQHWKGPTLVPELDWVHEPGGVDVAVADVTPGFHAPTKRFIAVGAQVRYSSEGKQLEDLTRSNQTAYAVGSDDGSWTPWQRLEMPEGNEFNFARSACAQWITEADGSILLPFYIGTGTKTPFSTTIVRCSFDGSKLQYLEHGEILRLNVKRGLYEPSVVSYHGRYFLTMRNDLHSYVSVSDDGLNYRPVKAWTFDDGSDLGSYNTQAHWLVSGDGLFLVYTRRGADNDHVMRHRAPLFIAQVDPERLHLIRSTEQVVVPERGATLGNFGVAKISADESWVTVGEGNVNADAVKRGADGSLFLARVTVKQAEPVVFSAMGCGPYSPTAEKALSQYIRIENIDPTSRFIIHCGDIVTGSVDDWPESQYEKVAKILTEGNQIPTFIVPGDNEWNDQVDPDRHWGYWENHFMNFDKKWKLPAGASEVVRQAVRPENFAFVIDRVLFIGINKVGGKVHDRAEWETRLKQDAEWISDQFKSHREATHSAVIFAQASGASSIGGFQKSLARAAREFAKPVLYLHADGHRWINEPGQYADNVTRVQLDVVNEAFPPVQVQVTGNPDQPFVFDRRLDNLKWRPKLGGSF